MKTKKELKKTFKSMSHFINTKDSYLVKLNLFNSTMEFKDLYGYAHTEINVYGLDYQGEIDIRLAKILCRLFPKNFELDIDYYSDQKQPIGLYFSFN
jgi:hypothetical protein